MKFILIICLSILLFSKCSSSPDYGSSPTQGSTEELIEREKIFLDFYGTPENRENSFALLKHRCESNDKDAHSCYNLAVLRYYTDNKEEALIYIKKANQRSPGDPLYEGMYRNLVAWKKDTSDLNLDELKKSFTEIEIACQTKNSVVALSLLKPLIEQGHTSKAMLERGTLGDCFSAEQKKELQSKAKGNPINYSEEFYKEKAKSDPFAEFWDGDYLIRKVNIEDSKEIKSKLPGIWKEFRIAVKSSQKERAKTLLQEFLLELQNMKTNKMQTKALERAAYFLIEQDDFFKNHRELLKEFGDKGIR